MEKRSVGRQWGQWLLLGRMDITQKRAFRNMHLEKEPLEALEAYPFNGNMRELENIMERIVALAEVDLPLLWLAGMPGDEQT